MLARHSGAARSMVTVATPGASPSTVRRIALDGAAGAAPRRAKGLESSRDLVQLAVLELKHTVSRGARDLGMRGEEGESSLRHTSAHSTLDLSSSVPSRLPVRFIRQQQLRLVHEGASSIATRCSPPRRDVGGARESGAEADLFQQLASSASGRNTSHAIELERQAHILLDIEKSGSG